MTSLPTSKSVANKEVESAIAQCRAILRQALPIGTFAEREAAALALGNEVIRGLLEEELQELADGLGDECSWTACCTGGMSRAA